MRRVLARLVWMIMAAGVGIWSPLSPAEADELRVATFRCDVTPPLGFLTYPPAYKPLEKIEHRLLAKGIVLDDGKQRYVLCAIDWCALCNSTYDRFRQKVAAAAGTDPARVAVHTIHQHTAPVVDNDAYRLLLQTKDPPACPNLEFFEDTAVRLGAAVKEALRRLQPFDRIGTGESKVDRVASTRRLIDKDGKVHHPRWSLVRDRDLPLRDEPEGLIDPLLKTITLARGDKPLVRLHYYACHPQSYYHDPRVTYDFPGMAREKLEKKEGVFQIYFTGCAGDVLVGKYNDGTPACREQFAQRLLAGMEGAIAATRLAPAESIQWRTTEVKLPLYTGPGRTVAENRARMADPKLDPGTRLELGAMFVAFAHRMDRPLALSSLQIGRVHILDLPGECLVDYQLFAQRSAPGDFVAVAAYTDLGPGYICTDRAFEEGGYEPTDTGVGPGSEPLVKAALVKLLGVPSGMAALARPGVLPADEPTREAIKAYCIDFNWGEGGPNGFARPGLWADADPARHVAWYKALGSNVLQTFCVSCNGYAWYKNGAVPEQPGLKHDFLTEVVRLGHKEGLRVMGYFCIGANTKWGKDHPDLSYGIPSSPHIPYTDEYLTYLSTAIRDAVQKTHIDGFMIDWVWQPDRKATGGKWLDCEKRLYAKLMGHAFPGENKLTGEQEVAYGRKAIDRCWTAIHKAAKEANPSCIIWLSCSEPTHPHVVNSLMYREVDWLMNEGGDLKRVEAVKPMIGRHTRLITCLANWNGQEPTTIVPEALKMGIGLYGFIKPQPDSLVPLEPCLTRPVRELKGDARNIAALSRAYHGVSLDSVKNKEGIFVDRPR